MKPIGDDDVLLPPSPRSTPQSDRDSSVLLPPSSASNSVITEPSLWTDVELDFTRYENPMARYFRAPSESVGSQLTASRSYSAGKSPDPSVTSDSSQKKLGTTDEGAEPSLMSLESDMESEPEENCDRTAAFLLSLFKRYTEGHGGCGRDVHEDVHAAHLQSCEDQNHHPLVVTYGGEHPFVVDRGLHTLRVGLEANEFPVPEHHARHRFMSPSAVKTIIEGEVRSQSKLQVCLHTEAQRDIDPSFEWDTDSVLVFPSALDAIKGGVRFVFTRQIKYNIDTDLHVERTINFIDSEGRARQRKLPLCRIPHLYIGSVDCFKNSTLFLFFPSLYSEDSPTTWLTDLRAGQFFSDILWPAMKAVLPDGSIQHYPPGSELADMKARARSREQQSAKYTRGLRMNRDYPIDGALLRPLWNEINHRIERHTELRRLFKNKFLFLNTKNIKVDLRSNISLRHGIQLFEDLVEKSFDTSRCEIVCDTAIEVCPPQPRDGRRLTEENNRVSSQSSDPDPVVLLWKTCCLRSELRHIQDTAFEGARGNFRIWNQGFLRDVGSLNISPPKSSWIYQGGWYYAQWYNPVKEIIDAQKNYPFDHDQLWQLAVDEQASRIHSSNEFRHTLQRCYLASKTRVEKSYEAYSNTSFGHRFEVRISYSVLMAMKELQLRQAFPLRPTLTVSEMSWSIDNEVWRAFMVGNFNKFTSLIECVILSSPRAGISQERSRLLYTLVQCLQNFASCHLPAHSLLWKSRSHLEEKLFQGLGFEESLETCGYGWWRDIFDWAAWTPQRGLEGELIGQRKLIRACYANVVRLASDTHSLIQVCLDGLEKQDTDEPRVRRVLIALAHFVLREYRRDVLDLLSKRGELREEYSTDHAKDDLQFCLDRFETAMTGSVHLVKGNRTKCKAPTEIFEWILGHSPEYNRTHFDGAAGPKLSYRAMLDRVRETVKARAGMSRQWKERLAIEFFKFHWVVPYPDGNGTLISVSDKGGHRSFWASKFDSSGWTWAAGQARRGYPPLWPETLSMDTVRLQAHINDQPTTVSPPRTRTIPLRVRPDDEVILRHLGTQKR